ncbi:MAG: creatininase family protein [Thermodesulfobacteriota bacterium]
MNGAETERDPLEILKVFKRLEVGPVRLGKKRIVCPYRLEREDGTEVFEHSFKYEEPVFDPSNPGDRNLAALVAAQVALNYGLFGEELVFRGPFDLNDRRFLRDMAQNTAREIYVKKFLEYNPFLRGPARNLPVVKKKNYLRARLVFPDPPPPRAEPAAWNGEPGAHAVLSSGGKESLLSYALLQEIGGEVTPVFINESGRHWFTALNAYRHFATHVPGTARVWTDSDRLFAWMLRHLPFIRPDFASVRSDDYPVRLWTVAVLIFAALPVLRRRGVSRLVVGDEFDTTIRANFQGISHYAGLYDQSVYFDTALSRYYYRKGWRVSQFSIVRSLSELLIEKVLVERYPDIQRHQVSCHAAHKEDGRVRPCGNCEKCRRIVGMLTALGADPTACGYKPDRIGRCLNEFAAKGAHQEAEVTQHAVFLLGQRGVLDRPPKVKPRPVVLKLRFDPVRSPMEGLPRDLRRPLYSIFLEHANGTVRRSGRVWMDFDLLSDSALDRPYTFEAPGEPAETAERLPFNLGELTWPQSEARFSEVDTALLPVGSIEQHGPHLPLDVDAFDAQYLARKVAEACSDPKPIVLPLIPYGVSYHHQDFPGTISINPETLSRLVYEVGMAAARYGITKLIIVNGHGGNTPALNFAAQMINRDAHIFTCVETGETSDADVTALIETQNDVHAGEVETSTALAVRPELVRLDQARESVPQFSSRFLDFSSKRSVAWYAHTVRISATGVMGDPTRASREKGERIWEVTIRRLAEFVEDVKNLTLEEIHQRRY